MQKLSKIPAGFPGTRVSWQGNREKSGKLTRKLRFFLHLIRVSGGFGFPVGNLPGEPKVFPCILSGFQGDIRFPTGKPGEKPRSYQRSREKSDSPQISREKTNLIRVHFGQLSELNTKTYF